MHNFLLALKAGVRWQDIAEIAILSFIIYKLLRFIKATRAVQVLKGIGILLVLALIARFAGLHIIDLIIRTLLGIGAIGLIIVFQPELRRALAEIGHGPVFHISLLDEAMIEEIVKSVNLLASKKCGALIVLERDTGLEDLTETGVRMDSKLSSEILDAIFIPRGPLHDGAVVIHRNRIAAAACIISIDDRSRLLKNTGTRHMAGISLSMETDAVVIIVSEETGEISLAMDGKIKHDLGEISLRNTIRNVCLGDKTRWWRKIK
jgi:diadenylate cyclase